MTKSIRASSLKRGSSPLKQRLVFCFAVRFCTRVFMRLPSPRFYMQYTHTCFSHWTGLPTKQLLAIPKVAGETLQWKKFLEISMCQRICGEVTQRWGCFLAPKLEPETKATHGGRIQARAAQPFTRWRFMGSPLPHPHTRRHPAVLLSYISASIWDTQRPPPQKREREREA